MKGSKSESNELKLRMGVRKDRVNEFPLKSSMRNFPDCPDYFNVNTRMEWCRVRDELSSMGAIGRTDHTLLVLYCSLYEIWTNLHLEGGHTSTDAKEGFQRHQQTLTSMLKVMGELGLTPSSRSRLKTSPGEDSEDILSDMAVRFSASGRGKKRIV